MKVLISMKYEGINNKKACKEILPRAVGTITFCYFHDFSCDFSYLFFYFFSVFLSGLIVLFINGIDEHGRNVGNTRERNIFKTILDAWTEFSHRDIITKVWAMAFVLKC